MEACATSLLGEPEYSGLVGVALRATRWASLSGVSECRSSLTTGGGAEDDLHQHNVKTTPGPPRGVMVPLVLLVHPDPP